MDILDYGRMSNLPEPEWLVGGLIQTRSTALMFGKSNSFKSFLAIDIGLSVDIGQDWAGNEVKPGGVLFVATEGANGVGRLRIPAWYQHHAVAEEDRRAFLYPQEICLDTTDDVTALIAAMNLRGNFALVVIDIFGGSMKGSEIEDKTARAWVHGIQRILRETGASVLVVAHTGWQDDTRARMHTHFWGSFDTRLRMEGDKDALTATLTVERHKDADSTGSWGFRMVQSNGSLIAELDASVSTGGGKKRTLSAGNKSALNALDDALQEHGVRKFGQDWPPCNVVQIDQWRRHCYLHSPEDKPNTKLVAFNRARKALHDGGHIQFYDDHVWRCFG
ncbi:AAA family ATPase [Mesorhizobium sp. Cs1321R2N1]|uniref:AAA family ATPase n=1 Tax=Mesorhizobium sp. Cs1321R2N1 TaxID=3015174 RepID=UPI00301E5E23